MSGSENSSRKGNIITQQVNNSTPATTEDLGVHNLTPSSSGQDQNLSTPPKEASKSRPMLSTHTLLGMGLALAYGWFYGFESGGSELDGNLGLFSVAPYNARMAAAYAAAGEALGRTSESSSSSSNPSYRKLSSSGDHREGAHISTLNLQNPASTSSGGGNTQNFANINSTKQLLPKKKSRFHHALRALQAGSAWLALQADSSDVVAAGRQEAGGAGPTAATESGSAAASAASDYITTHSSMKTSSSNMNPTAGTSNNNPTAAAPTMRPLMRSRVTGLVVLDFHNGNLGLGLRNGTLGSPTAALSLSRGSSPSSEVSSSETSSSSSSSSDAVDTRQVGGFPGAAVGSRLPWVVVPPPSPLGGSSAEAEKLPWVAELAGATPLLEVAPEGALRPGPFMDLFQGTNLATLLLLWSRVLYAENFNSADAATLKTSSGSSSGSSSSGSATSATSNVNNPGVGGGVTTSNVNNPGGGGGAKNPNPSNPPIPRLDILLPMVGTKENYSVEELALVAHITVFYWAPQCYAAFFGKVSETSGPGGSTGPPRGEPVFEDGMGEESPQVSATSAEDDAWLQRVARYREITFKMLPGLGEP